MVVLGINSHMACFSHFHSRHCEINFLEERRRARIDAENGHRRVMRPRLWIIVKETWGIPTGYLRAPGMRQSGRLDAKEEAHAWFGAPNATHMRLRGGVRALGERRDARHSISNQNALG